MRLIYYGRNSKKRKEFINQSNLLIVGIDIGSQNTMSA